MSLSDRRLIEAGFPCHQVGAETQRERGASSALPPLYFLHVWWARRPLTPSRAAILASLLPADTDPDWFLRQLGIERVEAQVGGGVWYLPEVLWTDAQWDNEDVGWLEVTPQVEKALLQEQGRRQDRRQIIDRLTTADPTLLQNPVIVRWAHELVPLPNIDLAQARYLSLRKVAADPAHVNERIAFAKSDKVKRILGSELRWQPEESYGYGRAFESTPHKVGHSYTILDPTAGGGSIPFEALRLGCITIANDLNPVASVIQAATLDYPARFGIGLVEDISNWGERLLEHVSNEMASVTPFSPLPEQELRDLKEHCRRSSEAYSTFSGPEYDQTGLLFVRQVTCPHCGGEAPLLNSCWLSKSGEKWGVAVHTDGRERGGKVWFEPYRLKGNRGPNGEDPDLATVTLGVGTCVHCGQQISADEIKTQARGESRLGRWHDRLYTVAAVRLQPKLDEQGKVLRYKTGPQAGEIRTERIRFFRAPNSTDMAALAAAERKLNEKWDEWESAGLIPTEPIPKNGHKTQEPRRVGMTHWYEMFTPRQLLGHLTLVEELNRLKPQILRELGQERGRAVVTYLQFMIDKGVDYNSRQTRWIPQRGSISGTFSRHDFSLKWTFGEMVFAGPSSGARWALGQVVDAFKGIAQLANSNELSSAESVESALKLCHGTAANLAIECESVDLICMDPPYYNNVQYAELSDFYYVWQRRTLRDLYPDIYRRHLTDKLAEAVANPARDGSAEKSAAEYERMIGEIFAECRRMLRDDGLLTLMFTHKSQEAWIALTRSLIESGWIITSSSPVESEFQNSTTIMDNASALSSVFLTCRKRLQQSSQPSLWRALGGAGVAEQIRQAVQAGLDEFAKLKLNPVDEMVACYGRALHVLSEHWPVMEGDELVSPLRAMNEASLVVAEHQLRRMTEGRVQVGDLSPEAAMALTVFGIYGFAEVPFDDALNLSRSLRVSLEQKAAGYAVEGRQIGYNLKAANAGKRRGQADGYFAPLVRQRSKLQLAAPEERAPQRLEKPQTEWDILQGLVIAHRTGDIPVARAYLARHAGGREHLFIDLLRVLATKAVDAEQQRLQMLIFGLEH